MVKGVKLNSSSIQSPSEITTPRSLIATLVVMMVVFIIIILLVVGVLIFTGNFPFYKLPQVSGHLETPISDSNSGYWVDTTPIKSVSSQEIKQSELYLALQVLDSNNHLSKMSEISQLLPKLLKSDRDLAIAVLIDAVSNGNEEQKIFAMSTLGDMKLYSAGEYFVKVLDENNPITIDYAVNAIRDVRYTPALSKVKSVLKSSNSENVKGLAVYTLAYIGSKNDLSLIKSYLNDNFESVQVLAASAMAILGEASVDKLLIGYLNSSNSFVVYTAIQHLGYIDSQDSREALQAIVDNPKAVWRTDAMVSLARQKMLNLSIPQKIVALTVLAKDENHLVRKAAIQQLEEIGTLESKKALEGLNYQTYY